MGGIIFLGLGFSGLSSFVLLSVIIVGLVVAGRYVVVIIPDVVGLFVVLCDCGIVLSSMSGAGIGRG